MKKMRRKIDAALNAKIALEASARRINGDGSGRSATRCM
jgi:hypothetical protein